MELLGHTLSLLEAVPLFSTVAAPPSHQQCTRVPLTPAQAHENWLFSCRGFEEGTDLIWLQFQQNRLLRTGSASEETSSGIQGSNDGGCEEAGGSGGQSLDRVTNCPDRWTRTVRIR